MPIWPGEAAVLAKRANAPPPVPAPRVQITKILIHRFFGFRRDMILAARVSGLVPHAENPAWEKHTQAADRR